MRRRKSCIHEVLTAAGALAVLSVLGCAGMAPLRAALQERTDIPLIDGVAASAHLARAAAGSRIKE